MADIFISHSSKDKAVADTLVSMLEAKGLKCWIAPRDILPGTEWAASINNAISETKVMIVIYSANSASSSQVPREVNIADKKNKFIIPYMIDETELSGSFEYFFTSAHWIIAQPLDNNYKTDELYTAITSSPGFMNISDTIDLTITYADTIFSGTYNGGIINGMPCGSGRFIGTDSDKNTLSYKGEFKAGLICGTGTSEKVCPNGEKILYEGRWSDNSYCGQGRLTHTCTDGKIQIWNGNYTNGKLNGYGTYKGTYAGGNMKEILYNGGFTDDKFNGNGKKSFIYKNGDIKTWDGEWKDGKLNGYGLYKMICTEGEIKEQTFDGEWKNSNFNGQGKKVTLYANGEIIKANGNFTDGNLNNGMIKITYVKGDINEMTLEGEWKDEILHGQRKYIFANSNAEIQTGKFTEGKLFGYGTVKKIYAEGDMKEMTFEGEWKDGILNGQGQYVCVYANGNIISYNGTFMDGKENGHGIRKIIPAEGDVKELILEANFSNGDSYKNCKHIFIYTNGNKEIYEGDYPNGQCKLTSIYANGETIVQEGTYVNGEFQAAE